VDAHPDEAEFVAFAQQLEPGLRVALMARFGPQRGREAAEDALLWAWEHWERIAGIANPAGYLYRVAQRRAGGWPWSRPVDRRLADGAEPSEPWVEPGLPAALGRLSAGQRQAVVLVEGYGWTYAEVAELLGVSRSTVQTHVMRGLERLRQQLGVSSDV
jgi:DNA-directed RNA polymerase specialized sigma24 family protein